MVVVIFLVTKHRVEVMRVSEALVVVGDERKFVRVRVVAYLGQVVGSVAAQVAENDVCVVGVIVWHGLAEGLGLGHLPCRLVASRDAEVFQRLPGEGEPGVDVVAAVGLAPAFLKNAESV